MSLFAKELKNMQNPAYGSALIYFLAKGYKAAEDRDSDIPLPVVFIAFPLLLDRQVMAIVKSTRIGLRAVTDKLAADPRSGSDFVLSLSGKVTNSRSFALMCTLVLIRTKLATLNTASATLRLNSNREFEKSADLPPETKEAEKLGTWLASLSLFELSSVLKVAL